MALIHPSKSMFAALASLVLLAALFLTVNLVPPVQAQLEGPGGEEVNACTQGATQWRTTGCCACNSGRQQQLWACNNGVWVYTGHSQCNTGGGCCAYPCCF